MAAVTIAIVAMTVAGLSVTLAIRRGESVVFLLATGLLYGSALVYVALLLLSLLHIPWSLIASLIALAALSAVPWLIRRFLNLPAAAAPGHRVRPHWLDIGSAATIAGYAFFATLAPPWEWDFWVIWGLKARVFFESRGIDWRFLQSRWNMFTHPDYPLLLPLEFDFVALLHRSWDDRWLGILFVFWSLALLLIVRDIAARETTPFIAALLTLTLTTLATSRYVGMAECLLIAFGGAAVLLLRRAIRLNEPADWIHGALFLGFAANVKNEGVALLVAVGVAMLIVARRQALRLWPAIVVAAPWLLLRATHSLSTDILSQSGSGSAIGRILHRLPAAAEVLAPMFEFLNERWFWFALCAGALALPLLKRESFVLLVTLFQLAFFVAAYFATPSDIRWHVATSWWRLTDQMALPLTFVIVEQLAESLRRHTD